MASGRSFFFAAPASAANTTSKASTPTAATALTTTARPGERPADHPPLKPAMPVTPSLNNVMLSRAATTVRRNSHHAPPNSKSAGPETCRDRPITTRTSQLCACHSEVEINDRNRAIVRFGPPLRNSRTGKVVFNPAISHNRPTLHASSPETARIARIRPRFRLPSLLFLA